jgi:YegS/Rv2252/BmrU family lipid kinase
LLAARGVTVQSLPTSGPGTAGDLARRAIDQGADLILVAGGDGTINEAVNGMVHSEVPLGILPGGTANVLANELALGTTMERAAASLCSCVVERVAIGLLSRGPEETPRYFLLMAGVGLDADIVYHLSVGLKAALGKAAYWLGGLAKLGSRLPQFTVEAEGRTYEVGFALASRVRNYGGDLEIAQTASLLEDQFELVLFQGSSSFTYLKYMLGVALHRHLHLRGVTALRTQTATFSAPPDRNVHVQVDGEYAGLVPAQIEIVPCALNLLVPADFRARLGQTSSRTLIADPWTTSPTR